MDKFMQQMREAFANEALWKEFQTGIWDTIYSTVAATLVACVLGIILGIILVAGEEDGVRPLPGPVMKVLNFAINILRSVPFLILMIMVLPLSELLVGTTIGTVASIPPLIIASASFVARLVETSLREVDKGVIEAAQSMGCSPFQIIWKVILPESLPSLVASFTTAFITILGYGAMAGAIGGGLWALVPAFFKARWGTNETLFTLMMNYIIIGVVKWLQGGPWEKIPRGSQQIEQFASNACLPRVAGVYCGWIVVLALTVFMFLYMKYTKHGYEIAVIGESENTARYAGMNVGWVIMRTMFLSGAIAGVVGFLLVSGANNTLYSGVAAGAGFTAITVAWLAQLNPFAMVGISALLAVLQKGADTLNTQMGIPASLSDVITGVLLFFMLGCEFFINYKLVFRGAEERHKRKEAAK